MIENLKFILKHFFSTFWTWMHYFYFYFLPYCVCFEFLIAFLEFSIVGNTPKFWKLSHYNGNSVLSTSYRHCNPLVSHHLHCPSSTSETSVSLTSFSLCLLLQNFCSKLNKPVQKYTLGKHLKTKTNKHLLLLHYHFHINFAGLVTLFKRSRILCFKLSSSSWK